MNSELKPGIYWVGGIDWTLREFHGYTTERGSTYNAYLIIDEKITLIDTAKSYLIDEVLERVRAYVNPKDIAYVIANHVEMDHSGGLPTLAKVAPNATFFASPRGVKNFGMHFPDLTFETVKTGDTLSLGKRTLTFVETPMVHWPDNMVTYAIEDKVLFSNDAFGQHYASEHHFDDELCLDILIEEAAKYYGNIVLPFGNQVQKALAALKDIEIDIIAPSHGIIWRKHIPVILQKYAAWAANKTKKKAVIIFDTMWGATKALAHALEMGLADAGVPTVVRSLQASHISDVVTDVLEAGLIAFGSPTINNNMLPTMGGFLTYLKGLRPKGRVGFAFGSYGWGGQSVKHLQEAVEEFGWESPEEATSVQFVPTEDDLAAMREKGKALAASLAE